MNKLNNRIVKKQNSKTFPKMLKPSIVSKTLKTQ